MLSPELTFLTFKLPDTYSSWTIIINLEVLTDFTITRMQYDDKSIRSLVLNHTISAELFQLMSFITYFQKLKFEIKKDTNNNF